MAFGVFAGVSFLGLVLSFWIQGGKLECEGDWDEEEGVYSDEDDGDDAGVERRAIRADGGGAERK